MKKILIIADGIVAKHFLERVINTHSSQSKYFVVYYDSKTIPEKRPENFKFYNFDPTSFIKLSNVLNDDLYQVMIIMSNKIDTNAVYKNIRMIIDITGSAIVLQYDKYASPPTMAFLKERATSRPSR